MNAALIVAGKEFRDGLRNRWVLAIALLLAGMAVGIAYFGAAASGAVGFTSLSTTIASLASLAVFLVPLIALLLAYDSVVGEREAGTLLLLLTYPLSRSQLLLGKFLGHGLILAVATAAGFGVAAGVIAVGTDELDLIELASAFGTLIVSTVLLGWVFVAFAYLVSVLVDQKSRAAGLALAIWFLFVLAFDLGVLAVLVGTNGLVGGDWLPYLLLLNPTDCFRLINLAGFEAAEAYSGLTSVAAQQLLHPGWLLLALLGWIAAPLTLAVWRFRHRHA